MDEDQRAAVEKRLRDEEIETVLCVVPDLWGRLMGKRVRTESFLKTALGPEGLHASLYLFVVDIDMDPRPGYEVSNWRTGFSDFRMVPDLATFRVVPWLNSTALVICDACEEDSDHLVEVAPRTILRRQAERAGAAGLAVKTAAELEFYLYRTPPEQAWARRYLDLEPVAYYRADYHILASTRNESFIEAVRRQMNEAAVEVEFSKSEWGLGQQEINLRYAGALEMADRHALYKNGLKEMAQATDMSVTFMAKPAMTDIGSSCHIHASVWGADGTAKMPDPAVRVENRMPGADVNPYLAGAATVIAGLDGIERQLDCGDPYDGDAYQATHLPTIPTTLRDGLALFADSPLAAAALGSAVHEHLVNFARQELEAFNHECVTDWERIRYFERI